MKDYYRILEVGEGATEAEIRKSYRRLAVKYHPDKNPGDRGAEERFKEIAEAYGVLSDPLKRRQYEGWRAAGAQEKSAGAFNYSQEEILRDLFKDPRFNEIFQSLFREFEQAGFRFDQRFFDQVFFGGRGIFFGGVFFWGPFGMGAKRFPGSGTGGRLEKKEPSQLGPAGIIKKIGKKVAGALGLPGSTVEHRQQGPESLDLVYHLTVKPEDAHHGAWVKIGIDRGGGKETLKVKIPPQTRAGTRLRLPGKGRILGSANGDLYITVHHGPES